MRYGIIGTGMMGREHITNIAHLDGAIVTALSDPHPDSLDRARRAVDTDTVATYTDHRDLLDTGVCDVVVVASPNHTHHDVLLDVLDAGVHVLVEKPLCTTVDDCLEVIDRAAATDRRGRAVWMGLEYRYMPPTQRVLTEVRAGTVGEVRMVAIREHRFPFLMKVGDWNRFNRNTGGTLVEKCCHFFDLMNLVTGRRPLRVMASGAQDVNHLDESYDGEVPDILDNAFVIVEYEGGARAMLDLCMFAEASRNEQELSIVGDAGKVEALVSEGVVRIGRRADGYGNVRTEQVADDSVRHAGLHHGASYLEHVALLDAIRTGSPAAVTLTDGLWSVAVGVAAHRSIDQGRVVELSEILG
ncbi:MAG: Gfo/Idh/MocA family oxidoreductase [Acidimicrobiia bacterium]|nr:Gfo/Idh/MocA family oxidoreductase [Acidimicrobiia bacterium]